MSFSRYQKDIILTPGLALAEGSDPSYLGRALRLTLLAPDIVGTFLDERLPSQGGGGGDHEAAAGGVRGAEREAGADVGGILAIIILVISQHASIRTLPEHSNRVEKKPLSAKG